MERGIAVVELSALRLNELRPLVTAMPDLDLTSFSYISVHAPSSFAPHDERWVVSQLELVRELALPIVAHPDVIFTPTLWHPLGGSLRIENMDKRKPVGRNVRELEQVFDLLPAARFCFDIGHARQVDPSMTESSLLLTAFSGRLAEVHTSEVNTASRHDPISQNAVTAFQSVARDIPEDVPIVLEALIDSGQSDIDRERLRAAEALNVLSPAGR
jgi:hypothetical protein